MTIVVVTSLNFYDKETFTARNSYNYIVVSVDINSSTKEWVNERIKSSVSL